MKNIKEINFDFSDINIINEAAIIRTNVQICEKHKIVDCRCNRLSPREMAILTEDKRLWIEYKNSEAEFRNKGNDLDDNDADEISYIGFDADGRAILTEHSKLVYENPLGSSEPDTNWFNGEGNYIDSDEYNDKFYYSKYSQYELLATDKVVYTIFISKFQYNNIIGSTDALVKYFYSHDVHELKKTLKGCNINATIEDVAVSGLILDSEIPTTCDLSQLIILSSLNENRMAENQMSKIVSRWKYKMSVSMRYSSNNNPFVFNFVLSED